MKETRGMWIFRIILGLVHMQDHDMECMCVEEEFYHHLTLVVGSSGHGPARLCKKMLSPSTRHQHGRHSMFYNLNSASAHYIQVIQSNHRRASLACKLFTWVLRSFFFVQYTCIIIAYIHTDVTV